MVLLRLWWIRARLPVCLRVPKCCPRVLIATSVVKTLRPHQRGRSDVLDFPSKLFFNVASQPENWYAVGCRLGFTASMSLTCIHSQDDGCMLTPTWHMPV